jgi:aminoglycoside phosphotransferase (APT) family kinase protein
VVEPLADAADVVEYHRVARQFAAGLPAVIGRTLAALQSMTVDAALPETLPDLLQGSDPAFAAPALAPALARVAAQWSGRTLLHGDLGFHNILVAPGAERVQLIGFEHARRGDPAWDAGAVLESYYSWSLDAKIVSDVEGPVCPLPALALVAAIGSFWTSYAAAASLDASESRARLVRAFAYAGVRLIARVDRTLRGGEPVTAELTQMMQAALVLMTSPAATADAFLAPPRAAWPNQWVGW